jgi:protein-disulfide isomerase
MSIIAFILRHFYAIIIKKILLYYYMNDYYHQQNNNRGLTLAIIFAAIVIGGSIVFYGLQASTQSASIMNQDVLERLENLEALDDLLAQLDKGNKQPDTPTKRSNFPHIDKENDYIRGNPDAPITLLEYSDFECPFCGRFHPTAKELVADYKGDVNWVYRHFPLSFHDPNATDQAMATECVGEQKGSEGFWKMTDLIYENTRGNKTGPMGDKLAELAVEAGANNATFKECMESEKFKDKVKGQLAEGSKAGVTGTPGNFIINNKTKEVMPMAGAQPYQALQAVIDEML